ALQRPGDCRIHLHHRLLHDDGAPDGSHPNRSRSRRRHGRVRQRQEAERVMPDTADPKAERYVRPHSAESDGKAPGRGRLKGRRILIVGGGQRIFDAATDSTGNGRAMSILCARESAHVAVADVNQTAAEHTVMRITAENGRAAGADRPSRGKSNTPFGRQAIAWEIAYAVLFFLSEEGVYITAQTLAVDAGLSGL